MKATFALFKKYWQFIVMFIANVVVLFLLSRKNNLEVSSRLKELNDSNNKKIDEINAARAEENKKAKENEETLKRELQLAEKRYESATQAEQLRDATRIEQTAKQYENKPDELASELSKKLNIDLYVGDKK